METVTTTALTRQQWRPRKSARSIRIVIQPEGDSPGVLRITAGGVTKDYFITRIPSDFGDGYRLVKVGLMERDGSYDVNLSDDGQTCECLGFLRHDHCKHADGIAVLIAAGRL
jgi:hypothetical protein